MKINIQPAVDADAMAAGQAALDRAKRETFDAMRELREQRKAVGARRRQGRTGAIHYDALANAIEERGNDVLTKAGDDYWNWEKRRNPWMCEDGQAPGTDSANGRGNRFGRVREKFTRGRWWHWDAALGGWAPGEATKGRGFDK